MQWLILEAKKDYRVEILSYYFFLKTYNYDPCFENQKSTNKEELADQKKSADLSDMPPPEGDEEKKNKKD